MSKSIEWSEFSKGINPRFMLPIDSFYFSVRYLPIFYSKQTVEVIANTLLQGAAAVVDPHPDCDLRSLRVETGSDTDQVWAVVALDVPVHGFVASISRTTLQLRKGRTQLREFVDGIELMRSVLWNLFPTDANGVAVQTKTSLLPLGIEPIRVTANLQQTVHLGSAIDDEDADVLNTDIYGRLAKIDDEGSPFALLQLERLLRGDIKVGFNKEMDGRQRQCWVTVEAPWNITQRDVSLAFETAVGDKDAPIMPADLADLSVPIERFYKDLILMRFFPSLFANVKVAAG